MHFNVEGQKRLQAVVDGGTTAYRVAQRICLTRADPVYRWLDGRNRPDPPFRLALERLFAIPADSWLTPEERQIAFGGDEGGGSGAVEHGDGGASCAL
jgi:hypothetical protein